MRKLDAQAAELHVFTFKEGALSGLAHDLELRVSQFELELEDATGAVHARIDPDSLRVVSAMSGGKRTQSLLGPTQFGEIERNIRIAVLQGEKFPELTFSGRLDGGKLTGELTLHGVKRPVELPVRQEAGAHVAELELDQRDFGITPFKALLGALRLQPRVRVVARVPLAS